MLNRKMALLLLAVMICAFVQAGCGLLPVKHLFVRKDLLKETTAIEKDVMPPKPYSYARNPHEGSLWVPHNSRSLLFDDNKARNVNDILTVRIMEVADASRNASTKLTRQGGMKSSISKFFGSDLTMGLDNLWGKNTGADTYAERTKDPFAPELESDVQNDFNGSGSTSRKDTLLATLSARVVEVYPNGNLMIKGRREVSINNEQQFIKLSGVVRPEDISPDNVVVSSVIADAVISISGKGVISDKQKPGLGHRIFDKVWPF